MGNFDFFDDEMGNSRRVDQLCDILQHVPINWVGNKKRMLRRLMSFIDSNTGTYNSFLDAFAGSGVVSMAAAACGKQVTANDVLTLSTTWVKHILSGVPQPLSNEDILSLITSAESKTGDGGVGFIADLYNGSVLSKDEVAFLNSYRMGVKNTFGNTMSIGKKVKDGVLADAYLVLNTGEVTFDSGNGHPEKAAYAMQIMCVHILQQAFMGGRCYKSQLLAISEKRLQSGGRQSKIDNIQRLADQLDIRRSPMIGLCEFISRSLQPAIVTNLDAEMAIRTANVSDVLYIDPPYGGFNSDYAWMYRVCEEFMTGRLLEECVELRETAVKFKGDDYERDKTFRAKPRKSYHENFATLLSASGSHPCWIISFNESSFASIKDIVEVVSSFRKNVVVETIDGYRYNYRDNDAKAGSEYMICAKE